ncbi:MAG: methyl-accepting chemotaxis protein [Deltaproteobacteria bacterium]|nr:methyl-accepting chemotaxis protein [Deltaproteobacteria bacterium]
MGTETAARAAPQRRTIFIEKAFQLRFIGKVTAVILLGTGLTGGLLYLLADKEFGRAFYSAHYQARSSWELLLPAVLVASFVSMCVVALLAIFLTLYDSHRIGGPLYRFKANLERVGRGDLTLVTRLRDGDELQSLTEAMNAMTRALADKVSGIREAEQEVHRALEAARGGAGDSFDALERAAEGLRERIQEFQVEG